MSEEPTQIAWKFDHEDPHRRITENSLVLARRLSGAARHLGCAVLFPSLFFLAAWTSAPLRSLAARAMSVNTALCFVLGAAALLCLRRPGESRSRAATRLGRAMAAAMFAIGVLTSLEYAFGWNLGIDDPLRLDALASPMRGRMSPNAAVGFALLGAALLSMDLHLATRYRHPLFWFVPLAVFLSGIALIGYIYGVREFYTVAPYVRISWISSAGLLLLSLGIIVARPHAHPFFLIASPTDAGRMLRRLIPAMIVLPVLMGWLRIRIVEDDRIDPRLGAALVVVTLVLVFCTFVGVNARAFAQSEEERILLLGRLKEAIQARDEFLSIASHELKTPLTSLKLQNQIRQRALAKGPAAAFFSPEQTRARLAFDAQQFDRIQRLVDDMLDVAKINSGKLALNRERFDLADLARDGIERLRAQAAERGVEIAFEDRASPAAPAIGSWDRFRIEQVLTNLLTNALKYGEGKPIRVAIERDGARARLCVRDEGRGIAAADHERVFRRFERVQNEDSAGGLGLGLYIARNIVLAHGGGIWVESEPGRGSRFIVELPIGRAAEPSLAPQPSGNSAVSAASTESVPLATARSTVSRAETTSFGGPSTIRGSPDVGA